MNKLMVLGFMLLFLVMPFSMAVDIDLKEDLKLGETFIAKVSGNFLDKIEFENIEFYRRHLPTVIENLAVLEIEEDFYIYGQIQAEKIPDNYSLHIKNVRYMNGAVISEEEIIKNFTVLNEIADFSVFPPVFFLNDSGSFELQNLMASKLLINFENFSEMESIELKSGEMEIINIPFKNDSGFEQFRIFSENQSYNIYVYFGINNSFIEEEIVPDEDNARIIVDENETETDVEDDEEESDSQTETDVEDDEEEEIRKSDLTCAELEGIFCVGKNATFDGEFCEGERVDSQTGECCLGECVIKKESNTKKTIGWLLIIAIVLALTWFFKVKFKK